MPEASLDPSLPAVTDAERIRGALWGMFVGDALAMPAHWYYDVFALQRDFGVIRDYQAPKAHHPSSIMPLASTGSAGRGNQEGEVIGSVILHGKKHYWGQPNQHYHRGMEAGENTLNLHCTRVLIRSLNATGAYDPAGFLRDYVAFMTTPGSHTDTYAESYHRDFFANYAQGLPPKRCAGAEGHDTASIGGLVSLAPILFAARKAGDRNEVNGFLLTHLRLTHRSVKLERFALALGDLLLRLMSGPEDRIAGTTCEVAQGLGFQAGEIVARVKAKRLSDLDVIGRILSPACYIEHAFPAVLYLMARYAGDFEAALIANTNLGGDNCHRGAVLGALLGAGMGLRAIPQRWLSGLQARSELQAEIESFVARFA